MKRMLLRGLVLAMGWLPTTALVAGDGPTPAVTLGPPVTLGRPRVAASAAPAPVPIQQVTYRGVSAAPAMLPSPSALMGTEESDDTGSTFAIQRVSLQAPVPVAPPMASSAIGPAVILDGGTPGVMLSGGAPCDCVELGMPEAAARAGRWYGGAEYLFWTTKDDQAPPLLTTVSNPAALMETSGALGNGDTIVLQDGTIDRDWQHGGRFTVGHQFGGCGRTWGLEATGFFLADNNTSSQTDSSQFPFLARPFFQLNPTISNGVLVGPREFLQRVATPGQTSGTFTIDAPSNLWGAELNARTCLMSGNNWGVDILGGPRYLNLDETLRMTENIVRGPAANPFPNSLVRVEDVFQTDNDFYGGQVGLAGTWRQGRWSVDVRGKVAIGYTHQTLRIDGSQVLTSAAGVQTFQGGLLALPGANIGTFSQDRFAIVPEVGINLGYNLTDNIRIFGGYNFLYWSSVLRPGSSIDRNLDVLRVPNFGDPARDQPIGMVRPQPLLETTDFWAQGLTAGLEFRW